MPLPLIETDLITGALVRLDMPDHVSILYSFNGIYRGDTAPGPTAAWLRDRFGEASGAIPAD